LHRQGEVPIAPASDRSSHRRAKRVRTDDRQAPRTDIEAPSHRQASDASHRLSSV